MYKFAVVILAVIVCVAAKPSLIGAPLAYHTAAAVVAPAPFVTATSSQVVARNHNGIATAPIIAPVAAPLFARTVAVAPLIHSAPLVHSAPFSYSSPLHYAASPVLW